MTRLHHPDRRDSRFRKQARAAAALVLAAAIALVAVPHASHADLQLVEPERTLVDKWTYPRAVTAFSSGFAVAAYLYDTTPDPEGFYGWILDDAGQTVASFPVDSVISYNLHSYTVADVAGNLIVAWSSSESNIRTVSFRVFSPAGAPLTSEIVVATGSYAPYSIAIVPADDGGFTIAWSGFGKLELRAYDSSWQPRGPLNSFAEDGTVAVAMTSNPAGGIVLVRQLFSSENHNCTILAQKFDDAAAAVGSASVIDTTATGVDCGGIDLAATPDETGFLVVHAQAAHEESTVPLIASHTLDSALAVTGSRTLQPPRVNLDGDGAAQGSPDLVRWKTGYLLAWTDLDGLSNGGFVMELDADGEPIGSALPVNSNRAWDDEPRIAAVADTRALMVMGSAKMRLVCDSSDVGCDPCIPLGLDDDADNDGVSDQCDRCVNSDGEAASDRVKLEIKGIEDGFGGDVVKIQGQYLLPPGAPGLPDLEVDSLGVRIRVESAIAGYVVDKDLPDVNYPGAGWLSRNDGYMWSYSIGIYAQPGTGRIRKVRLKQTDAPEGRVIRFKITGKYYSGFPLVLPQDLPLGFSLQIGGIDSDPSQCTARDFSALECDHDVTRATIRCEH